MKKDKILIIDDHKEFRGSLKAFIEKQAPGFEVCEAKSGEEGLDMAMLQRPKMVLIDTYLPKIDGIEVERLIKQCLPDCQIISMSTFSKNGHAFKSSHTFIIKSEIDSRLPEFLQRFGEAGGG